ncbi:hypothetical protein WICANDRAFT_90179, partial [Wickerhamomyces anomalus NRRL Y-366-8]
MKIYGFDDEVILSGANLSSDYFTNRQDRYYLFKSKDLSDYYYKVQHAVESLSYKLIHFEDKSQFRLVWPTSNPVNEPGKDIEKDDVASDQRTFVYPISQFTPLLKPDISTEKPSILKILGYVNDKSVNWTFTAGYFNMLPEIKAKLLESSSKGVVITASPYANGFYKSKGISGCLPDAYLYLSKLFLQDVFKHGKKNDIILNEWKRGVGLWATASNEEEPSLTVIGSSNYTRRAYSFDLETNAVVVTNDKELKSRMSNEVSNLLQYTNTLSLEDFKDEERKVNNLVIFATKLLGKRL